jgi:hypothetical protein
MVTLASRSAPRIALLPAADAPNSRFVGTTASQLLDQIDPLPL